MTDQRKPLTPDEERLAELSAEVRAVASNIGRTSAHLINNINTAAQDDARAIVRLAGHLAAVVRQRENTLARVQQDRGTPIRFANAGECSGFQLAKQDLVCGVCGHPAERHGGVDHLGDTQARPVAIGMTEHTTRDGRHIPSPPSVLGFLRSGPADAPSRSYGYAVTNCPGFHNGGVGAVCIRCGASDSTHPARRP